MESKEYFEKVMQDYNQNRKGRSLRKYCKDEAVDYDWLPVQEELSFTGETSGVIPGCFYIFYYIPHNSDIDQSAVVISVRLSPIMKFR